MELRPGDFVELRDWLWLVERPPAPDDLFATTGLSCIADDAQGEALDVLLDAKIEPSLHGRDEWQSIGVDGTDSAGVLSAYLRVLKWN